MIKRIVFVILFVGLGLLFFLQKQHEKRAALEAKRRAEAASKQVAHTGASDMTNAQNAKEAQKTLALLLRSRDRLQCCPSLRQCCRNLRRFSAERPDFGSRFAAKDYYRRSRRCLVRVNGCLQCSWQF